MKAHTLLVVVALVHCEKAAAPDAGAPITSVTVASATPTASAAPSAAPTASAPENTNDVVVSIRDAATEPSKSVKVSLGGKVTLFLPDTLGTSWSVDAADKSLGKAKEEIMPGFAKDANAHQFRWDIKAPLKAGETHKVTFVNKKAGKTFALTIEIIAP